MKQMKLLKTTIDLGDDYIDVYQLRFLKDNPRVYACTHGHPNFDNLIDEEQQEVIFDNLIREASVKKLMPEVRRHGGLIEPILIRHDTMEVIEGNSRLAVYRLLLKEDAPGEWNHIPCDIVSSLTEEQQAAFLNQIHVKGKSQWSAYEKANFAYVRKEKGCTLSQIANLFGESEPTIRTRIKAIETMKGNNDGQRSHFSYYDVLVRHPEISKNLYAKPALRDRLLKIILDLGSDDEDTAFTAQELRGKLPVVLNKPKILKKFIAGTVDLDNAYQSAKINRVEERVRQARNLLQDVSKQDVVQLDSNNRNALKQTVKKLSREVDRIEGMLGLGSNG